MSDETQPSLIVEGRDGAKGNVDFEAQSVKAGPKPHVIVVFDCHLVFNSLSLFRS